jgi:hypothetical protein
VTGVQVEYHWGAASRTLPGQPYAWASIRCRLREHAHAQSSHPIRPIVSGGKPRIAGIVNITADSFSDGGRYLDPAAALAHARRLRADGADVIEMGPAASHPGSAPVTTAEERRRLAPVLERLGVDGIAVSVDSFWPGTLRFAVSAESVLVVAGDPAQPQRPYPDGTE